MIHKSMRKKNELVAIGVKKCYKNFILYNTTSILTYEAYKSLNTEILHDV